MIAQPDSPLTPPYSSLVDRVDPRPAVDLRRTAGRDLCEMMVMRSRWLTPDDHELVRLHFGEGETAVALARLMDLNPRRLRARLRRLAERMLSHRFEAVLRGCDHWPARRRNVARAVVLEGRTFRNASKHLRLTLHQVRREMAVIEASISSHSAQGAARNNPFSAEAAA